MALGRGVNNGGDIVNVVWWLQRTDDSVECGGIERLEARLKKHGEGYRVIQEYLLMI